MKKILIISAVFLTLYGCQNNSEILPCRLDVQNGITYTDGKVYNGTCNIFYNDSILWKTRTYKRGIEVKEISYYLDNGEKEYVGYKKNGQIDGEFTSYYRNGNISIEGTLNSGKYIGEWKYYDDDGSLNKILNYDKAGNAIDTTYSK